ncbi:MAG: class III signal peptide-containing protein [Euryarchaeota archaeon]|nr:class III signal peptide-containing protein [Euryarchaeota archaeon]
MQEEKAQGSIEYILLAGAIIVGLIIIIPFYRSATRGASVTLNTSVETTQAKVNESLADELTKL